MNIEGVMEGHFWPEPIEVVSKTDFPEGFVTIEAIGLHTFLHYTTTIPLVEWKTLQSPKKRSFNFRGSAQEFRLALEAERLRLAYSADPLLAANNSKVHLLPHQMEAVYSAMLPQPRIRHLMAHDAGAGKTVMCGLLYKELLSRTPDLRTLIVTPAALTVQWQREFREKFLVSFDIVERNELKANARVWTESPSLITSMTFARQNDVQATLSNVKWDLVIVDEAHHLAGYENRETLAYRLGQILSRQAHHLVLATATPHKGDSVNFLKLLQLLDEGIDDPAVVSEKAPGRRGTPLMLRRLKEEMVDFDGQPLFKPRVVETRWHIIADNPPEMELYTALTNYVNKTYRAAERLGGRIKVNTEFAMVMLQRRMGSSFTALEESLKRRQNNLLLTNETSLAEIDLDIIDELPESERWEQEQRSELATPAKTKEDREKEATEIALLLEKLDAIRGSDIETKVLALKRILDDSNITPGNGEKLLVFTEFKDTLDFLRRLLEGWGFTVTQIDGSMTHERRRKAEKEFSQDFQIMLATEAAGEGINLQFCAYMVNYDLPWIPSRLEQRMGRIHRYGQKRVAHIYNLTAGDTREGQVLLGLLKRLDDMRQHLGDQVFDVISTLVSDIDVEKLLARVATSPSTEASQDQALHELIQATMAGEERYRQWEEHPFAISPDEFRQMQEASRQSRLTPEYAQHFFVDVLTELKEEPKVPENVVESPGDADIFRVELRRTNVAKELQLPHSRSLTFSFRSDASKENGEVQFIALGTALFDCMLQLAQTRWGKRLSQGAIFMDINLAPGDSYLLWFLSVEIQDGCGNAVDNTLFAVRQSPDDMDFASAASLIDLIPADTFQVPLELIELSRTPQPVLVWSTHQQQLSFLAKAKKRREFITELRRNPLLADAKSGEQKAEEAYNEMAFGADDEPMQIAEEKLNNAQARVKELEWRFRHEEACSLNATKIVGVAAVVSLTEPPPEDLIDEKPDVAAAAARLARQYEEKQGRTVRDVSGEHEQYPYDLHSTGPGGVHCIEVKGTTTGKILLSENERRAARRLGLSYYLYIVRNPLSSAPRLTIIRDPLSKMEHDDTLYSGVRYAYNATTWQAAADEEIPL